MRELIKEKFKNHTQKYFFFSLKSKTFSNLLDVITAQIASGEVQSNLAISLIKSFKSNGKGWLKLKSVRGRSNQYCECLAITESNLKFTVYVDCNEVLESEILISSPKSLKLFKKEKKRFKRGSSWKKPDDGFNDNIISPTIEEELTEVGYELYKDWQEEIRGSGMSAHEYKLKYYYPHGYSKRTIWLQHLIL